MKINLTKITLTAILVISVASCTKEVPPELQNSNKQKSTDQQKMPDDSIHRSLKNSTGQNSMNSNESGKGDEGISDKTVLMLLKEADDADSKFKQSKSEKDKEECIEKQMLAANFLMFEAELPPKDKYKPALLRYRRVLELDPKNTEAAANKKQIEDIYESMGKPIPN
jgi:predicted small lipoprotein YifL